MTLYRAMTGNSVIKLLLSIFIVYSCLSCGAERRGRPLVLVCPKGLSDNFFQTVKQGAEDAARECGVEVLWNGPPEQTDISRQIAIVEDHILMGVDAIVIAPCDSRALIDPLQRAVDAGIPVVIIDSGIESDIAASFIATDNVAGARLAGETLAQLIGGRGPVGCIPFVAGAATSTEREQGFREAMQAYPDITVAHVLYSQSQTTQALAVTEDMLTATPDLRGIFAANEIGAIGAIAALEGRQAAGRVKLVAFDASPTEIEALRNGTVQALVAQNPHKMGYLGVQTAWKVLRGQPVEKRIDTGVTVITKDNLDSPEVQALLNPGK